MMFENGTLDKAQILAMLPYKVSADISCVPYPLEVLTAIVEIQETTPEDMTVVIEKLVELQAKYPTVPVILNILAAAYERDGNDQAAVETTEKLYTLFPNDLYAIINKAHMLMGEDRVEEVTTLLPNILDLQALYPERAEFHEGEVILYSQMLCRYFSLKKDLEKAVLNFGVLNSLVEEEDERLVNPMMLMMETFPELFGELDEACGDEACDDIECGADDESIDAAVCEPKNNSELMS